MTPRIQRHLPFLAALAICAGGAIVALHEAVNLPLMAPDSLQYAETARSLARGQGYTLDLVPLHLGFVDSIRHLPEMHGLLRPVLLAGLFGIFGQEDWVVRLPGIVYVAATGLVVFGMGRRIFGPTTGVLACAFFVGSRPQWLWGLGGVDDSGLAFYFLASLDLFHRGLTSGRDRWFALGGLVAGVGLLEKLSAIVLPAVVLATLVTLRGAPWRAILRRSAIAALPVALALLVYLVRNQIAHGGWAFRFSPLEWLWKLEGPTALFALYDPPPTLTSVFLDAGPKRIAALVGLQLSKLGDLVYASSQPIIDRPYALVLGLPALLLHREQREFVHLAAWSSIATVTLVCVLYHVEDRYLSMLVALLSIPLAGALVRGASGELSSGAFRTGLRALALCGCAALIVRLALVPWSGIVPAPVRAVFEHSRTSCEDAMRFIRQRLPEDAAILTPNPWLVTWLTDRPAVMVPTNGPAAVRAVVHHYGTRWALLAPMLGRRDGKSVAALLTSDFAAELLAGSGSCRLYRLERNRAGDRTLRESIERPGSPTRSATVVRAEPQRLSST